MITEALIANVKDLNIVKHQIFIHNVIRSRITLPVAPSIKRGDPSDGQLMGVWFPAAFASESLEAHAVHTHYSGDEEDPWSVFVNQSLPLAVLAGSLRHSDRISSKFRHICP